MIHTSLLRRHAAQAAALALVLVTIACDYTGPEVGHTFDPPVPSNPGIHAYLTAGTSRASIGGEVRIDARIAVHGVDATVSGFVASLAYDHTRIELVEEVSIDDGGVRVANLGTGNGEARFAGASSSGFTSDLLFSVRVRPRQADYLTGLRLSLQELNTLEEGFAERSETARISNSVHVPSR